MSLIRWGEHDSDLYIFESDRGWEIFGGPDEDIVVVSNLTELRAKMLEYRERGWNVPNEAFDRLDRLGHEDR